MRPGVNAWYGPQARSDPINNEELHGSVTAAPELQSCGEDGVEVTPGGGEGRTDHAGGHKAVNGHGVLRLLHADEPGADPADPGGDPFDDGPVQDRNSQISRADVVDGGVGSSDVSLGNLNAPEDLNEAEHSHPTDDLSDGSDNGLLLRHVALHAGLKVIVRTGGGVSPVKWPPDRSQEKIETVGSQAVVISDYGYRKGMRFDFLLI